MFDWLRKDPIDDGATRPPDAATPVRLSYFLKPRCYLELSFRSNIEKSISCGGQQLIGKMPPFHPPLADILYDTKTRAWIGITYMINREFASDVRKICGAMDNLVYSYVATPHDSESTRYPKNSSVDNLEISWGKSALCKVAMAQVFTTWWYAAHDSLTDDLIPPYAISIDDVDEVLSPGRFILPDFEFGDLPWKC